MGTVEEGAPPEPRLSGSGSGSGVESAGEGGAHADPMLGRTVAGRFVVNAKLGSGSMGTVYRATQWPIGREVAVKILRTDRGVDDASRARFLREARANSALTSPNTVTVFDFGQGEDGELYLAMELLEGESVGERVRRLGRLPVVEAVDVTRQALTSLVEAHDKGIIHRDLKPDNLFFARIPAVDPQSQGRLGEIVKVLDFGVAKMLRDDTDMAMNAVETQAGTVFGTPRYMSPEQAQGKPLDPRTDLYSLGVILYHMLTGQPPFTDDDAIVVMARHIKSRATPLREAAPDADIPQSVDDLVMRALAKEPDSRPSSAEFMLAELEEAALSLPAAPAPVRISFRPAPMPPPRAHETWMGRRRVERASRARLLTLGVAAAVVGGFAFAGVLWFVGGPASNTTPNPASSAFPTSSPFPTSSTWGGAGSLAAPTVTAATTSTGTATPNLTTASTPVASDTTPTLALSSLPPAAPSRPHTSHASAPAPLPASSTATKPVKKKQVGYGYLE
jgi:serine/threonine-protein kinase